MLADKGTGSYPDKNERRIINGEGIKRDIIVIGASAGGVAALMDLFASFPPHMAAIVGVVLHRSQERGALASVLGRRSTLPLVEPSGKTVLKQAHIYLAPPDQHLLFETRGSVIQRGPKEHSTRPAIDPLFRSAAAAYGKRVVGILLTGAGQDGVSGLIAISRACGITLAQDPEEAYMPYMPLSALRSDDVHGVFRIKDLASVAAALAKGETVAPQLEMQRR